MDREGKFWVSLWAIIGLTVCVLVGGITVGAIKTGEQWKAVGEACVNAGGTWASGGGGSYQCIGRR